MKVIFRLKDPQSEKTSIFADVSFFGKRYKISTGQSIKNPELFWLPDSLRAKYVKAHPEGKTINQQLDELEDKIIAAVKYFTENGIKPDTSEFRNKVFGKNGPLKQDMKFAEYMEDYIENSTLATQTLKNYNVTLHKLTDWQQETGEILRFSNVDIHFYRKFEKWFKSQINPNTEKPYTDNFFGSLIKIIKKMMNQARADGLTDATGHTHKDFRVTTETAETVYLNIDELKRIHYLKITPENLKEFYPETPAHLLQRKIKSYEFVKDLFLIGAFTGLRVSDFRALEDINFTDGLIRITTRKTGARVIIPMHPIVEEIIENFDFSRKISEQKINKHIKNICHIAGITQKVSITRTHAGRKVKTTIPKNKLITTHTARRSAATNMFKAGVPAISIMKITGHTTEKSFMKYIKISEEENAELLKKHPFFNA